LSNDKLEPRRPADAKPEDKFIYETPDGGNTVYARKLGTDLSERKMVFQNPEMLKEKAFHERWHMYRDILEVSEDNEVIAKLLEQVELLYRISK